MYNPNDFSLINFFIEAEDFKTFFSKITTKSL